MQVRRSVMFEGVEFIHLDDELVSVIYDGWPFPIEQNTLGYPGGYPMPDVLLDEVVGKGKTGRQLNESMNMARDICLDAFRRYPAGKRALA